MVGISGKVERGLAVLGGLSLLGLAAMQFARVDRHDPRIDETETIEARTQMPAQIAAILHRGCRDCHTENTVWPWYSSVAPMLWLMVADVNAGREHMNFSKWGRYRLGEQLARLGTICEMVRKDKMPLWYYRPLHPSASLSGNDVAQLCAWTDSESALLAGGAGKQ
jgi:Haem-binding domain